MNMLRHEFDMLPQPITRCFDLDDGGMMKKSVKERGRDDGIAEDVTPFRKRRFGVRIMAPLSYCTLTSWKSRLPPPWRPAVADLIDDAQAWPAEEAIALLEPSFRFRTGK